MVVASWGFKAEKAEKSPLSATTTVIDLSASSWFAMLRFFDKTNDQVKVAMPRMSESLHGVASWARLILVAMGSGPTPTTTQPS